LQAALPQSFDKFSVWNGHFDPLLTNFFRVESEIRFHPRTGHFRLELRRDPRLSF